MQKGGHFLITISFLDKGEVRELAFVWDEAWFALSWNVSIHNNTY
jgi:hypothetical protein